MIHSSNNDYFSVDAVIYHTKHILARYSNYRFISFEFTEKNKNTEKQKEINAFFFPLYIYLLNGFCKPICTMWNYKSWCAWNCSVLIIKEVLLLEK